MQNESNRPISVFLCHASNDKPSVRRLYKKLSQDHIDVWFDEERLLPGHDWDTEIQRAVRISDVVIICLSNSSVTKEGYVQKEIKIALDIADEKPDGTIFIIPVRLEECDVPERIKRWQWIDLFSPNLNDEKSNFRKLVKSLEVRSAQINKKLYSKTGKVLKFEPDDLSFAGPRAWIAPIFKHIFRRSNRTNLNVYEIETLARRLQENLLSLDLPVQIVEIDKGPRFIRFGVEPLFRSIDGERVKVSVSDIASVKNNLSMMLGPEIIQIEPVPNHSYIGIDMVSFDELDVNMLDILESKEFQQKQGPLNVILGRDITGMPVIIDLSKSPNMLLCGAINTGKSTCLTGIISCLLANNSPEEMKLLFIDARRVEFSAFFDVPHLLKSTVITDMNMAISAFAWLLQEVNDRKRLFSKLNVRNIDEYNLHAVFEEKLPVIIVFVNELPDLLTTNRDAIEKPIIQITGLARVVGIQIIISTRSASPAFITDAIKANLSNRIAFKTFSALDSQTIIDHTGAENLLSKGDMLFLGSGKSLPLRVQGVFVSEDEVMRLVEFWRSQVI